MGTGCSTETSLANTYGKSHNKDDGDKIKRNRSQVRKQSTTSSSDVNVKVNKPWTESEQTTTGQKQLNIKENDSSAQNLKSSLETKDPNVGSSSVAENITASLSSSHSPQIAKVESKEINKIKIPSRLMSLPADLQDLLLGHSKDPSVLTSHPHVIHLKVIVPQAYTKERVSLWSNAFMPLRILCAERGFVLDIQDDYWSSPSLDRAYINLLTLQGESASHGLEFLTEPKEDESHVDIIFIFLVDAFSHHLPAVLSQEDYTLVHSSLSDSAAATLFLDLYSNNENRVPLTYELNYHVMIEQEKDTLNELVNMVIAVFQREHKDIQKFHSDYHNELFRVLQDTSVLMERTLVVSALSESNPDEETNCKHDLAVKNGNTKSNNVTTIFQSFEKACSPENCLQICSSKDLDKKQEHGSADADVNFVHPNNMSTAVKEKLERLLLKEINDREENENEIATGVPHSLTEELITQTQHHLRMTKVKPLLESPTLTSLQDYITTVSEMPIVLFAEPGWGLSTMGAQIVSSCARSMPGSIIIYRFMGISPDSHSVLSMLLSVKQQLDIILGPCRTGGKEKISTMDNLLSDIVSRSTEDMPILIILEGISLSSAHHKELRAMTLTELLPASTKLLLMTSDPDVAKGLRAKMKDAFFVKAMHWDNQRISEIFTERMNINKQTLTDSQSSVVTTAIRNCPLPMYAVTVTKLASTWKSHTEVCDDDLPSSLEGILGKLFAYLEYCIPLDCFAAMIAYLTISFGGISKWEMIDLLSSNESALLSVYPNHRDPAFHRAPTILWKLLFAYLGNNFHHFHSKHFYIFSWTSGSLRKCATGRYVTNSITILHKEMSDYFVGQRTNKKKPLPDPKEKTENIKNNFIMTQPDIYGKYLNVRKFMCLPFHLMNSKNNRDFILKTCIFNLLWIENKLNSVSVLQILCDLEQAKSMETSVVSDISAMQQAIIQSSSMLQVHGREIYKCLQYATQQISEDAESDHKSQVKRNNGQTHFSSWLSSPSGSFLYPLDEADTSVVQTSSGSIPAIDTIVPLSNNAREANVVVTLRSEGEVRVINTVRNENVKSVTGLDLPQSLQMLNSDTAVVLCNRELYIIDLDKGELLNKLRGVLNLKMPFFGRQNSEKVVALSRDRMVVNILDVNTGGIISTFKAGETRFLDSLIISGDGSMLVCGDETQKPFPLLVWSLEQCKLIHDIRIPQHEFMTQLADITHNGQYLACGCREVNNMTSNFVVVYDLISGQLFRKFKMASLCKAVSLASKTMCVLIATDTGQLAVWDLVLGNLKFLLDGSHTAINNIILSVDDKMCLTTYKGDDSISSYTVSLWNIDDGNFIACHTFDSPITCVQFTPDGHMVLAGVKGHPSLIRLLLVPGGSDVVTTKGKWEAGKDSGNTEP